MAFKERLGLPAVDFLINTGKSPVREYRDDEKLSDIFLALTADSHAYEIALDLLNNADIFDTFIDYINSESSSNDAGEIICRLVKDRKFDLASKILKRCSDINTCVTDINGYSAWHYAVINDDTDILFCLLNYGKNGLLIKNPDNNRTPLSIALYNKQFGLAKLMVENFLLSKSITSDEAGSLILILARGEQEDWAIKIIKSRVFVNRGYIDTDTENSALHYAVIHEQRKLLPLLLILNFDISLKNKNDRTPLGMAVYNKTYDLAALMLEKDFSLIHTLNRKQLGEILLHYTKIQNHTCAYLIVTCKDSYNTRCADETGNNSLHYSVINDYRFNALTLCKKS